MAGQRGRDVLISIGDGNEPEVFFLVAGIRARTINLTAGLIEATSAQSAQAWSEVIAGAGVKRAEVAGSGVFKDAASDAQMWAAFFAGKASTYPGVGRRIGARVGRSRTEQYRCRSRSGRGFSCRRIRLARGLQLGPDGQPGDWTGISEMILAP